MRYVWRDCRITMQGITEPEDFYLTPDYHNRELFPMMTDG